MSGNIFATVDWAIVLQIMLIDILLGGDNAVVIALACRNLHGRTRLQGILWGSVGAIVLRVLLVAFAVTLLTLPTVKLIGGALLLWIGFKLMLPDDDNHGDIHAGANLVGAIRTIIVADLVMSLDNVVAIAGAAQQTSADDQMFYVAFGLLVSIPFIVFGSQFLLRLIDRFPLIITLGAALLGYISGEMAIGDPVLDPWIDRDRHGWGIASGAAGASLVVAAGTWWARRRKRLRQFHATRH